MAAELVSKLLNTESVADTTNRATHDETIHFIPKVGAYEWQECYILENAAKCIFFMLHFQTIKT